MVRATELCAQGLSRHLASSNPYQLAFGYICSIMSLPFLGALTTLTPTELAKLTEGWGSSFQLWMLAPGITQGKSWKGHMCSPAPTLCLLGAHSQLPRHTALVLNDHTAGAGTLNSKLEGDTSTISDGVRVYALTLPPKPHILGSCVSLVGCHLLKCGLLFISVALSLHSAHASTSAQSGHSFDSCRCPTVSEGGQRVSIFTALAGKNK